MASLRLSLALGEYDRTRALLDGQVRAEGLELQLVPMNDAFKRHDMMIREGAFDVCELSMSSYLMARQRGQALHAIPVFPYRMFRHSYIVVNTRSGIERPQDLAGKRVATSMYQTTTALWVRGHLQHEYGVQPHDIHWLTEMPELVGFQAGSGVQITQVGMGSRPEERVEQLIADGQVDAAVLIEEVPQHLLHLPHVLRLFPNYVEVEREFYQRTRIYPVMHALVAKGPLLREHPWIAESLRNAFEASKQVALEQLRFPRTTTFAWHAAYREQEIEVFGPDPYPFGVEANRPTLEALATYSHEQGLTQQHFPVEELFVGDTA
jgi:4,5-dihydroxyphthalate decarboxylase